jgi:glucokinase
MKKYYLGVDIGATKISAGLIKGEKIIKKIKVATEVKKGTNQILENIKQAIKEVYSPKVKGIGIGIAGQINPEAGLVVSSPNLPKDFKNVNLRDIIQQDFKKPIRVENDANCFALGEAIYGAGKGYKNVIGLTLGTGIGGGIIIDQKIYHGQNSLAGEIGHTTIIQGGLTCSCGQKGHLEAYASGNAMVKLYQQITGQEKDTFFIAKQARAKEKAALKVFKTMNQALAIGLANTINIFNPDIIVLGGSLVKLKLLTNPAIELARKKVVFPALDTTKIVTSKLKDEASLLGTVALFKK